MEEGKKSQIPQLNKVDKSAGQHISKASTLEYNEIIDEINTEYHSKIDGDLKATLTSYIEDYDIINELRFNEHIKNISDAIRGLKAKSEGKFAFVTSYPGKSNFWVTTKILEEVLKESESLEDYKVYLYKNVKEKGALNIDAPINTKKIEQYTNVIFLDDGAYSGSQLSNLLNKFRRLDAKKIKLGIIAMSEDAEEKISVLNFADNTKIQKGAGGATLVEPIVIAKPQEKECKVLNQLAKQMCPAKFGPGSDMKGHKPGLYQTAFYYKVPDYASTMNYMLLSKEYSDKSILQGNPVVEYQTTEYLSDYYHEVDPKTKKCDRLKITGIDIGGAKVQIDTLTEAALIPYSASKEVAKSIEGIGANLNTPCQADFKKYVQGNLANMTERSNEQSSNSYSSSASEEEQKQQKDDKEEGLNYATYPYEHFIKNEVESIAKSTVESIVKKCIEELSIKGEKPEGQCKE